MGELNKYGLEESSANVNKCEIELSYAVAYNEKWLDIDWAGSVKILMHRIRETQVS